MNPEKPEKRKYRHYSSVQYLTRAEAAKLLGVHPMTITRLEKRGLFPPSHKLGRGILRYDRSAVERYLAAAVKAS
jgi:excisionase family DNA binding protein